MKVNLKNEFAESLLVYQDSVVGYVEGELITDLDELMKRTGFSEKDFCKEYGVEKFDKSLLSISGRAETDKANLFYESKYGESFSLYGVPVSAKTLDELKRKADEYFGSIVEENYRGFVITKEGDTYTAECEGLMSSFSSDDLERLKRSVNAELDMLNRASVDEYGGNAESGLSDSERFVNDIARESLGL